MAIDNPPAGQYLAIRRRWSGSNRIAVQFDMTPRITAANPRVEHDARRVAIERGPLVYCMEQIDQPESAPLDGYSLALTEQGAKQIEAAFDPAVLGGVVVLRAPGICAPGDPGPGPALYHPLALTQAKAVSLKLIPYYAFANRAASAMQVWIPYVRTI